MKQNSENSEYISQRRRRFTLVALFFIIFGCALYIMSAVQKLLAEYDIETINPAQEVVNYFFPSESEDVASKGDTSRATDGVSTNLLKDPVLMPFSVDGDRLLLNGSFSVGKEKVENAVFSVERHGSITYSVGFSSNVPQLFCKGAVQNDAKQFFIYFCEKKHKS